MGKIPGALTVKKRFARKVVDGKRQGRAQAQSRVLPQGDAVEWWGKPPAHRQA
jgi:hypothetical protein